MLNFHRECWNPVKKHSKALVFFAVSMQIPIVYLADRGRADINLTPFVHMLYTYYHYLPYDFYVKISSYLSYLLARAR